MHRAFFKNSEKQKNNPPLPGAKITIEANNKYAGSLGEKAMKRVCGELGCCKAPSILGT